MLDRQHRFIIEQYQQKPEFASFLPGIAGLTGVPLWSFYVNRGQGIASFGSSDKERSILEFYPAQQSYEYTARYGFRTFLRFANAADTDCSSVVEAFGSYRAKTRMAIGMNELEIEDDLSDQLLADGSAAAVKVRVRYYILPEEPVGGLIREVTVTDTRVPGTEDAATENCSENRQSESGSRRIEIIDGLPAILPFGVGLSGYKEIGQTLRAWMQAEDVEERRAYYRVRFSTADSARVSRVEEGNYFFAADEKGGLLPIIADVAVVFAQDTGFGEPVCLQETDLEHILAGKQVCSNKVPSAMTGFAVELKPGESRTVYEVYGQADHKEMISDLIQKIQDEAAGTCQNAYFMRKHSRAQELTRELTDAIGTRTGDETFDEYCRLTYLDNVLRGGEAMSLTGDGKNIFYAYSRKHGDLERDYNFFRVPAEPYSQGNGAYRDVNQNRRSDVRFHPEVGEQNIRLFMNLLQIDGYNPLTILPMVWHLTDESEVKEALKADSAGSMGTWEDWAEFFESDFTPGSLAVRLNRTTDARKSSGDDTAGAAGPGAESVQDEFFRLVIGASTAQTPVDFSDGYWSDHWTYNLDLIESYLSVYPDRKKELLFGDDTYIFRQGSMPVMPRLKRYERTEEGVRQYHFLYGESEEHDSSGAAAVDSRHWLPAAVRTEHGEGEIYHTNLASKLLSLIAVKFSTLDCHGLGIEMEGGKPGWYDALNGLPAMLGSSMAETYELLRLIRFLSEALKEEAVQGPIRIPDEIAYLMYDIRGTLDEYDKESSEAEKESAGKAPDKAPELDEERRLKVWNKLNNAKEFLRSVTYDGVRGGEDQPEIDAVLAILSKMDAYLTEGVNCALAQNHGVPPTYFRYDAEDFHMEGETLCFTNLVRRPLPDFLEGAVHYIKLLGGTKAGNADDVDRKRALYRAVRESGLYDRKLSMYKVNASLSGEPFDLGRCTAFVPGWLENESIWLHMEYKYVLQLLKAGLYHEFLEDFGNTCIAFLDPKVYGRSTLENSSFLVSSANPDESLHGRGFVARLSGAAAEFLEMWQIMMFGKDPIVRTKEGEQLQLQPIIPEQLISEDGTVTATLLGKVPVTYHLPERRDYIPGEYEVTELMIYGHAGSGSNSQDSGEAQKLLSPEDIGNSLVRAVMDGRISGIHVVISMRQAPL